MIPHRPYPKIHTHHEGGAPTGVWVATEKIHGAQIVVATDGEELKIGKRKAWLKTDEPFFGWQLLRRDLEAVARSIHQAVDECAVVRIYGELFGGRYPHPNVPAIPGVSAIQTGIWYAPDVRFLMFDVLVEREASRHEFLAHSEIRTLAAIVGCPVVPLLGRGHAATLQALPVYYPTELPALLGLPPLKNNNAEGYVLTPDVRCAPEDKISMKRKIPEFDDARFDESAAFCPDQRLNLVALQILAGRLVNEARIASARSKVGQQPEGVCDEVVLDVLIDLEAAFPTAMKTLMTEEEDALRAHLVANVLDATTR